MKPNRLKAKIAAGEAALGVSLMFPAPQLVEMLAYAGFDWVLIDCEHGSIGPEAVELMAMAADAAGITAIARPRGHAAGEIQAVLDRGVAGVQVPHVNSAEIAARVVKACRFGPTGEHRSLAAGTRPDRWGLHSKLADYAAAANDETLVCVQIEHAAALADLDAILRVEGIDVFFVGPSDLSQSLGHPGDPKAPAVARAIQDALAKIRAAGKAAGLPATTETVADVVTGGCRYVYTHLPRLLGAGAATFLAAGRGRS